MTLDLTCQSNFKRESSCPVYTPVQSLQYIDHCFTPSSSVHVLLSMSLYPPPVKSILKKTETIPEASNSNIFQYKSILKKGSSNSESGHAKSSVPRPKPTTNPPTVPLSEHVLDRFPLELIDYCLSFLHDEPHALGRCALVSRVWHYLVDAQRFRKSLVLNVSEGNPKVLAFATSSTDSLAHHVVSIVVQVPNSTQTEIQQQLWLDQYAYPLLALCRRLRSVSLYNISKGPPRNPAFSTISVQLQGFRHLRQLNLARCEFVNFRELLSVVCAPRRLQVLALSEVKVTEWNTNLSTSAFQISPHLTRLHLYAPITGRLLHWLNSLKRQYIPEIATVHLSIPGRILEDHRATGTFLKSLGQHLRCLHFNLPMGQFISHIDLSENTQLQELSVTHCFIRGQSSENTDESGALMTLIRNINSQVLRRLIINFINTPEDVLAFPWGALSTTLALSSSFPALRRVAITVNGRKDDMPHLRLSLKELSRRRILQLDYVTEEEEDE
ncbi:hypothetical protein D9619_010725 [Psilocybe cf. subviscida]|uniref:F-box domain-containing protein n=1 Tax=Psilocybe cf. subviscida TaxID=2480587 RepID=A0A8H5F005_9AGAR|nr:hypothetical protein D9619_010725 [Psilocybe cf. subviscida]